jgi:hypothetical protein
MAQKAVQRIVGRFTEVTPVALFRMQGTGNVRLRLESTARAAGRTIFDITEHNGFVLPREPSEERFLGPNGMPVRPKGSMLAVLMANFRAARPVIFEVPQGTRIPAELVLLHEHSDHYSVQPATKMTPAQLNKALTNFLSQGGVLRMTKQEFYERHPDMHPMEVGFSNNA